MKKILVIASMMLLGVSWANAAGTAAGTQIQNSVTLDYTVGGINQTDINADDGNGFLVDNKNDVLVTTADVASVKVTPGATTQVLTFTVKNEGNKVQDFILSVSDAGAAFSLSDNFNATSQSIFVESGTTPGYQLLEDTATYIDELAADGEKTVYVVANIPASQVNGDASIITLTAQVATGGTASSQGSATVNDTGADAEDTEQIVWADSAGETDAVEDGKHSDASAYEVQSASLTVTKGSCVIWDPANEGTNPKRIPGAVVRYTIQVANAAGAQDATSVVATDVLPGTVTYGVGGSGLTQIARVVTEVCSCTSPGTANTGNVSESTGTVTATYESPISASETQCAYFDVTIN